MLPVWLKTQNAFIFDPLIKIVRKFKSKMVESDRKRELILEGAIKRFAHFGINKTSMSEIADDLSVTKPALYYYFPDKQSLIVAVADRISSTYLEEVEKIILEIPDREEALMNIIELRRKFFQKYFMLHMEEDYTDAYLKDPSLITLLHSIKSREAAIIAQSIQKGVTDGELLNIDALKTTELLLDTLRGLRSCMKAEKLLPDAASFEEVLNKQKDFARIFLTGIKNHANGRTDIK